MIPGQPEHYGDVTIFLQPDESEPGQCTLGIWGPEKTVEMPYGMLRTRLCRPSEVGLQGFDHLFGDSPLPMARRISPNDVERIRAALQAATAAPPPPATPGPSDAPSPLDSSDPGATR
jgi:hypothetical protein